MHLLQAHFFVVNLAAYPAIVNTTFSLSVDKINSSSSISYTNLFKGSIQSDEVLYL